MQFFELILARKAARQLGRIERGDPRRFSQLLKAMAELKKDPYGPNTSSLKGRESDRRMRVGATVFFILLNATSY